MLRIVKYEPLPSIVLYLFFSALVILSGASLGYCLAIMATFALNDIVSFATGLAKGYKLIP